MCLVLQGLVLYQSVVSVVQPHTVGMQVLSRHEMVLSPRDVRIACAPLKGFFSDNDYIISHYITMYIIMMIITATRYYHYCCCYCYYYYVYYMCIYIYMYIYIYIYILSLSLYIYIYIYISSPLQRHAACGLLARLIEIVDTVSFQNVMFVFAA